jgi:ABC-type glutathione transport system ATPase component
MSSSSTTEHRADSKALQHPPLSDECTSSDISGVTWGENVPVLASSRRSDPTTASLSRSSFFTSARSAASSLRSLTINKLRFRHVFGRASETEQLEAAFAGVHKGAARRGIVWMAGPSGVGKTTLARKLYPCVTRAREDFL